MNTAIPMDASPIHHFLAQSDGVGRALFAILLAMSLVSWFFILIKTWQVVTVKRRSARFLKAFWETPSLEQLADAARQATSEPSAAVEARRICA